MAFPLSFPSIVAPSAERLTLNRRQSATESPWTYAVQVVDTAAQWQLQWSWPRVRVPDAEKLVAWGLSLKGQIGTFRYSPRQIASDLTGRSLSNAAYAYNDTILAGGWGGTVASGLRLGQWFSIGNQLLRITSAGAFSDPSGRVAITFEPSLRIAFAGGTAINFVNPAGVFRLNDSNAFSYTLDPDRVPDLGTIMAREVVS